MNSALFHNTAKALRECLPNSLSSFGVGAPSEFASGVRIIDPWQGDAGAGKALTEGVLTLCGAQRNISEDLLHPNGLQDTDDHEADLWLSHLHSFLWLRDLRALGGKVPCEMARGFITSWISAYGSARIGNDLQKIESRPDVMGQRISMWASHYESFVANGRPDFRADFVGSLYSQAAALHKEFTSKHIDQRSQMAIPAACGLIVASIAIDCNERWRDTGLSALSDALSSQILPDGGHASRSPAALCKALAQLVFVRCALVTNSKHVPEFLNSTIERMGLALRFFRYADRGLGLFHGSQEGDTSLIDAVLSQAGSLSGRTPTSLPLSGYERLAQGRSVLLMDVGASPSSGFDGLAHAAPLAFEFCHGRERVFVSCGTHPTSNAWRQALRATPAHCSLTLGDRNACEIGQGGGFTRRVSGIAPVRDDGQGSAIAEACHDGYVPVCGVTHKRRVFLTKRGQDLRGQETLTSTTGVPAQPISVAVRFHLHPRVSVALVRDGGQALLRVPGGAGWNFMQDGAKLSLENSVYLGQGNLPRKTKQIVLSAKMDKQSAIIRWALARAS